MVDQLENPTTCIERILNCDYFFNVDEDSLNGHITIIAREQTGNVQQPLFVEKIVCIHPQYDR